MKYCLLVLTLLVAACSAGNPYENRIEHGYRGHLKASGPLG